MIDPQAQSVFEGLAYTGPSQIRGALAMGERSGFLGFSVVSHGRWIDIPGATSRSKGTPLAALRMYMFPADEQRISDVERGRSCRAVVPLPVGGVLSAGDTILFALSQSSPGQPPAYVKEGDCVVVSLTEVTSLADKDPISGQELVQIAWNPLGQAGPPAKASRRVGKKQSTTSENSPGTV